MLSNVNLLPWREAKKEAHKKRFIGGVAISALAAIGTVYCAGFYFDFQEQKQQDRLEFLSQHIAVLDSQIDSLKQVEKAHEDLVARLAMVESLQKKRNKTTQFMDLIPQMIPEGVYVDQISMNAQRIEMSGISDSTAHLATMLDLLEHSSLISDVEIHSIVSGSYRFDKPFQSFEASFLFDAENGGNAGSEEVTYE